MADHQPTTEHVKEEVDGMEFEVDSQDEHPLCTACLCATRTTRTLDDGALKQYYMHILTEMQTEGGVVLQSPRVCWECVSHLKRAVRFREQVQDSYRLLQPMLSMCDKEDLDKFLQSSVCYPGRLKACYAFSIDISPQDDHAQVMTDAEHDDDEATSRSSGNDIERRFSTFQEELHEDPSGSFCDEKYENCVSEELVELSLTGNYNHDKTIKQDKTDAFVKEFMNDITINILNSTDESTGDVNTTFVCDYCYKRFTSKAALERHIATYNIYPHNNKTVPSPCEDCVVVLCSDDQCSECPNKHNLLQHNNMKTNILKDLYENKVCHKSFSFKRSLMRHTKTLTGPKSYQCEVCQKSFAYKSNLVNHLRTHTGAKPFQCEVCYKSFSMTNALTRHKRLHTGEKPYQCKLCHKSFSRKGYLMMHFRTHTREKPYQCEVCHKSFSQRSSLNNHLRLHTGEKPYQCKVCHKSFSEKNTLARHIKKHTGEKPYQCEVCHKSFAHKHSLVGHLRKHTGEKPFQCEVCYKSFSMTNALTRHKRLHTGEKPYQCKLCHKSFSRKGYLMMHFRTHTREKPYQCKVCHKSFSARGSLVQHFRQHTGERPYQCEVCHKSYALKSSLVVHLKTHTGEKPFQCEECRTSFFSKAALVNHIRKHTGEKPFQCKVCHKSFKTKSDLTRHKRLHTGLKTLFT